MEQQSQKYRGSQDGGLIYVHNRQRFRCETVTYLYERTVNFIPTGEYSSCYNFIDLPEDEWDRVINTNLKGLYLVGRRLPGIWRNMAAA